MNLEKLFLEFCIEKKFEINQSQIEIINHLQDYYKENFERSILSKFLGKKNDKLGFYLTGDVGVGKTMILDFFYESLNIPKQRMHFNEFMINFHNYRHKMKNKDNSIISFVKNLKKFKLIYLDEFQVTNIVDAMILGKLFETIFNEDIKLILTSNTKIDDLYKDGLQREQFLPFISIIKKNSLHIELILENDYRRIKSNKLQRVFYPINEKNIFKINQIFRELTKNKKNTKITLTIKGRKFFISNFYEGIARFDFKDLCDKNIGAEDYLEIAKKCKFIIIENIPKFDNDNSNQQNRFITLIDILYEKNITLLVSLSSNLNNLGSSNMLRNSFKRSISRLYELTSPKKNI